MRYHLKRHLPKHHDGESPTTFILITDNKFDFYNITEIDNIKYKILDIDIAFDRMIVKRYFHYSLISRF